MVLSDENDGEDFEAKIDDCEAHEKTIDG